MFRFFCLHNNWNEQNRGQLHETSSKLRSQDTGSNLDTVKNIVERLRVPFTRNYLNRTKIQYQSESEGVILRDPRSLFKATASADNTLLDLHNSSDDTQPHSIIAKNH